MSRALWWVTNGRAAAPPAMRLHHRRLDFDEAAAAHERADLFDDADAQLRQLHHLGLAQRST